MTLAADSAVDEGTPELDVIVVGAGLAGLYALYRLRERGFTTMVFEAGDGIGGTWYHNRYPGARCDIESLDYSYSFSDELQQEWHWTERYASAPEILRYINHVADRFDLRRDIRLATRVVSADFDEDAVQWRVTTEQGDTFRARFIVMASGVLSAAQVPDFPGLDSFRGSSYHTADWPVEEPDFTGLRVGVVGTGSSGTQLIPIVARQAAELLVFQRTANYCMPAQNRPLDPATEEEWKAHYPERRAFARQAGFGHNQLSNPLSGKEVTAAERQAEFERRWELGGLYMMRAFRDILTDPEVNGAAADFVHEKIASIVRDPATADLLKPKGLPLGTKRLCSGTDYYETFNRPNVRLIDVRRDPIVRVTEAGLRTRDSEYELDVIIFATGFDAMTGSALKINPRGRRGLTLSQHWIAGPRTYLGLMSAGFPNLFFITGPQSPSVFSNMVTSIEQHGDWVTRTLEALRADGLSVIEPTAESEGAWAAHTRALADRTLYRDSTSTWFHGANIPGKPVTFMVYVGGVGRYGQTITRIAEGGYPGFLLDGTANADAFTESLTEPTLG